MAFNCGGINFDFDALSARVYNTREKLIHKLIEKSRDAIDPKMAILQWMDENFDSINKRLGIDDKKKFMSQVKYSLDEETDSEGNTKVKKEDDTENDSDNIADLELSVDEDEIKNIGHEYSRLFRGNQLLETEFVKEFTKDLTRHMIFYQYANSTFLCNSNFDLNTSLYLMRKKMYKTIYDFLLTTELFKQYLSDHYGDDAKLQIEKIRVGLGNFDMDVVNEILSLFALYLKNNISNTSGLLTNQLIIKINDSTGKSSDQYAFLNATYAYLGLKYFDTLIKKNAGNLIVLNKEYKDSKDVELGRCDYIKNENRVSVSFINKYSFGTDRSKQKMDWTNQDQKNAVETVARYTENLLKLIDIKTVEGKLVSDSINISYIGQSWNGFIQAVFEMAYSGHDMNVSKLKDLVTKISENPVENIVDCLRILYSLKSQPSFINAILNTGKIDRSGINVLTSIYNLVFDRQNPTSLIRAENKDIYAKRYDEDGSYRKLDGAAGIMATQKIGLIVSLMEYMSPSNYIQVKDSNGVAVVLLMTKNSEVTKRKLDHIENLNLLLYRTGHSQVLSLVDGSQGVEIEFNNRSDNPSKKQTNTLTIRLNGQEYLAQAWSFGNKATRNIFGDFTSMTLHRKLDSETVADIIDKLKTYGIEATENTIYSPELNKKIDLEIDAENKKENKDEVKLDFLNKTQSLLLNLMSVLSTMSFGRSAIANVTFDEESDEDIQKWKLAILDTDDENEKAKYQKKIDDKKRGLSDNQLILKPFLQFASPFLNIDFLSQESAAALSYAILSTHGLTLSGIIQSAIRSAAVTKIVSDFYQNLDDENEEVKIKNFNKYYDSVFGANQWNLISDKAANIKWHGNGMNFPNRLPVNETWVEAFFTGDAVLNNKSLPSTTVTGSNTRVANYRNNSVAASYLDTLSEIARQEQNPAHNNLFAQNPGMIKGMAYDEEIMTAFETKKTVDLSRLELLYHYIKHLFFDSLTSTDLIQVQPGVVADKVSIPEYGVDVNAKFQVEGKERDLATISIDDIVKCYHETTTSYFQKLARAVIDKYIRLFKFAKKQKPEIANKYGWDDNYSGSEEKLINDILHKINQTDFNYLIGEYNKNVRRNKSLLENNPDRLIVSYNSTTGSIKSFLDTERLNLELNLNKDAYTVYNQDGSVNQEETARSKENLILERLDEFKKKLIQEFYKQNDSSANEIAFAPDADYRVRDGKYFLHELIFGYKNFLTDPNVVGTRFKKELRTMISLLMLFGVSFDYADSFKELSSGTNSDVWTGGLSSTDFKNIWVNNGKLILAQDVTVNSDGSKTYTPIYDASLITEKSVINPMFERYFYIQNLLQSNMKLALVGDEIADPDKTSGVKVKDVIAKMPSSLLTILSTASDITDLGIKILEAESSSKDKNDILRAKSIYNEALILIIAACESALNKRNSIIPATEIPMMCNTINGINLFTKMAIISDLLANMYNIQGDSKKLESQDGSAWRTAELAILENGSLGDQAVGYELAKTIWYYKDPETGRAMLGKWAVFTLTNAIMHNSLKSDVLAYKLYKKMTNIKWDRDISLCHSRKLKSHDDDFNFDLDFKRDILSHLNGGLYYTEADKVYQILDLHEYRTSNTPHIYITTETTSKGDEHYCAIVFNLNSNAIRFRSTDAAYQLSLKEYKDNYKNAAIENNADSTKEQMDEYLTEELIRQHFASYIDENILLKDGVKSNLYHTCNSNFELNSMLGGINTVNSFDDTTISESSHFATTFMMNNVIGKVDMNKITVSQDKFELPLKQMFIGYAANETSIKRMLFNINPSTAWNDDSDLLYVTVDSRKLGKLMDADHDADDSKVSEMSLVVASLNAGGEKFLYAKLTFEALGRLASNGMHMLVLAFLSHFNIKDDKERKKSASFIYHILGQSILNSVNEKTKVTDITTPIIELIRTYFKLQGIDTHDINNSMEKFLPLSDPNIFNQLVTSLISDLNRNALKRKYQGLGAVLVPSYHMSLFFHLSGNNAGLTFLDVYNIATNNIKTFKAVNKNGLIIVKKGLAKDPHQVTISLNTDGVYEIDITNILSINKLLAAKYIAKALLAIPKLQKVQFITTEGDNAYVVSNNSALGYIAHKFGVKNTERPHTYIGTNEEAYKSAFVDLYLQYEQNKEIYYHDVSYFVPSDNVDVVYNTKSEEGKDIRHVETIQLDSHDKYYEFKHAFNKNNINAIKNLLKDKAADLKYIDDNFGKIITESGVYSGLLPKDLLNKSYTEILENSNYKQIIKYIRLSLYDFRLRENIVKPADLRPQRITFRDKITGDRYNIFDLDVVRNRYFAKADTSKHFVWGNLTEVRGKTSDELYEMSLLEIRKFNSPKSEITLKINGDDIKVDPLSIENEAAEIAISNIHKTEFQQGDKTLAEIEKEFEAKKPEATKIINADFVLLNTKSNIGLICHLLNLNGNDAYTRVNIKEDIINENGEYNIYAIDKLNHPKYQIGTLVLDNNVLLIAGEFCTKPKAGEVSQTLNQDDYVKINDKIYRKNYFVKKYIYKTEKTKKQVLYIDSSSVKESEKNNFIGKIIKQIAKQDCYGSILLNGYLDYNNRQNLKLILESVISQKSGNLDSEFNISATTAKSYLEYLDSKNDDGENVNNTTGYIYTDETNGQKIYDIYDKEHNRLTYINSLGKVSKDTYFDFLKMQNKARIAYQKGNFELSKYILSARIPALTLLSYMQMKIIAYIPVSTNQAMVSAFQTWLQGSDYDIDKAYLMSFQYDNNGHFIGWSNLFDYSTPAAAVASLELPMGTGKIIKITKATSSKSNINTQLVDRILNLQDRINESEDNSQRVVLEGDIALEIKKRSGSITVLLNVSSRSDIASTNLDEITDPKDRLKAIELVADKIIKSSNVNGFELPSTLTDKELYELNKLGFSKDPIQDTIKLDRQKLVSDLKVKRIKTLASLLNNIASSNESNIEISTTRNISDPMVKQLEDDINAHEAYEVPVRDIDAANKNFVASRIMLTVNDPANMLKAYTYITIADLKKLASGTKNAKTSNSLTSMNPLATPLLQYENMDGKKVIGISAIGEKVYMGLSYYYDAGIRAQDSNWTRYMQFFHTTNRVAGRSKGDPKLFIRTTKTDNTYRDTGITEGLINELIQLGKIADQVKKQNPGLTTAQQNDLVKKYVEENKHLFTQADQIISLLLSAATDNAKELILSKLNCGQQMAKLYLHMLILGYDINDIVAFMTSDSVNIIDSLVLPNMFANSRSVYTYDIQNAFSEAENDPNFGVVDEDIVKDTIKGMQKLVGKGGNFTSIYKLLMSLNANQINKIYNSLEYGDIFNGNDYSKTPLFMRALIKIKSSEIKVKDFLLDLLDFIYLEQGAQEMSNLGTLMGVAKGLKVGYDDNFEQLNKIQKIFNRQVNMYSFEYTHDGKSENVFGISDFNFDEEYKKQSDRAKAMLKSIIKAHPNYKEEDVFEILKNAYDSGVLFKSVDSTYKAQFDLGKFLDNAEYRRSATDLYDIFKNQYNIFDVAYKIPQYRNALNGLAKMFGLLLVSTAKGAIVAKVQKDVVSKNAPFEKYEIAKALRYADDLLTFSWLLSRDKDISFELHAGDSRITSRMDKEKVSFDQTISINSVSDLQTFKLWMESVLIPSLKQGSSCNLTINGNKINVEDNNAFLNHLQYSTDNGLIYYKLNFSMNDVDSNSRTLSTYATVQNDFMKLDSLNHGLPTKLTDYFILYNMLVNYNLQGNDRMTNLFSTIIHNGDSILEDYHEYLAKQDAIVRSMNDEEIELYLVNKLGYYDMDALLRVARRYSSRTKKHRNEYIIIEEDPQTKQRIYKKRINDRSRFSNYSNLSKDDLLQYPWLNSSETQSSARMRNLVEDGVMNIPVAGTKQSVLVKLSSENIQDIAAGLQFLIYARKLNVNIKC